MDELQNKGFNSEDGTPYEQPGVNRLEKGFDSENGTPYEPAGGNPFGDNDFDNAEVSTQHQFESYPKEGNFDNIGQHNGKPPEPPKQYNYGNTNGGNAQPNSKSYYEPENNPYDQQPVNQYYNQYNGQNDRQPSENQYDRQYNGQNVRQQDNQYFQQYHDNFSASNQPYPNGGYQYAQAGAYPSYVQQESPGMAIVSFVLAMVNLLFFRSFLSFITVPICLILAIVCIKKQKGGKGFAIAGIVVSIVSTLLFASYVLLIVKLYPDLKYFAENQERIIAEFTEDGTIPEQFEKYDSPKFTKYWNMIGCKDFKEFFKVFIEMQTKQSSAYPWENNDEETDEDENRKEDRPMTACIDVRIA